MYLVIAEKPSVSNSIAKVLGAYQKKDGYLEGRDCVVSWCLGHLAEYVAPDSYDERFCKWRYEDLPIIPGLTNLLGRKICLIVPGIFYNIIQQTANNKIDILLKMWYTLQQQEFNRIGYNWR